MALPQGPCKKRMERGIRLVQERLFKIYFSGQETGSSGNGSDRLFFPRTLRFARSHL
jgi:hypothetical protein